MRERERGAVRVEIQEGQEGLYEPVLVAEDGKVRIPDGPGWGVRINQDWLERSSYQISSVD